MKKFPILQVLLFFSISLFSQNIPEIKLDKGSISVKKLKITVEIVGDIAVTTYDMSFYNATNTVLEGELNFPLGENQSVTRFALDINGKLREAVVVEKEKARVAFESTIRNRIDPALLEQTIGNNYKARIYPIPSRGYKRVVLAYQQKLILNNDSYYYKIPFSFKKKVDEYSLSINILNQKNKPIVNKGVLNDFKYNAKQNSFSAKINKKRYKVAKPLLIKIPLDSYHQKLIESDEYFYFTSKLNVGRKNSEKPTEITLFWDNSLSQKDKKINSEIEFLEAYFKNNTNVKVNLVVFNFKQQLKKMYSIQNSNWASLKNKLLETVYDGATSFDFFKTYKDYSDVNFVFTNGLNTLSSLELNFEKTTHFVNSITSANHNQLKYLANNSGGYYINLQQSSIKDAIAKTLTKPLQILGTNFSSKEVEIYPKIGSLVSENISISGKNNSQIKDVEIYIGTVNDTLLIINFQLKGGINKIDIVKSLWAEGKLNNLVINSKENEREIVRLSKKHKVISPFTSLLILDRIEDYVAHEVVPPKELKKKYYELLDVKVNDKKERINKLRNDLIDEYADYAKWHNQIISKDSLKVKIKKTALDTINTTDVNDDIINSNSDKDTIINTPLIGNEFVLKGVIVDNSGSLPGVSVLRKGTTEGTETDFDGKFSIKVSRHDYLVFNYLGYKTVEIKVTDNKDINVTLLEDANVLDEVVVLGYGVRKIFNNDKDLFNIINNKEKRPLFILNGKVVNKVDLKPSEIHSLYILNQEQGKQIFGEKAKYGIVVYVSEDGYDKNIGEIEDFEDFVREKTELKGWNPETPYLKILNSINDINLAYGKYLELRNKYGKSPSFYIDIADYFKEKNELEIAKLILTNVAEIDLSNYELLKALAYKFEEYELWNYAVFVYEEVLRLRPEDIQSYRDLALAYEQTGFYQKSFDLLYSIVNGEFLEKDFNRRYKGVEVIALQELNRLLKLYKEKINFTHVDENFIINTEVDIKILIDWNHNDTDIDLWVFEPNGDECYYGKNKTKIGGLMSDDMTDGFGPEQYSLKKAIKGNYKIEIDYYSSDQQKISGPTFLKVTTFTNYAKKNERRKVKLVRLKENDETIDLGSLVFTN